MSLNIYKSSEGIEYIIYQLDYPAEKYFDFFNEDWFDSKIMTIDKSILICGITSKILLEAMSKEQKELGQREVNKIYSDPLYKLKEYLLNKWNRPKTKEEYIKKNLEFKIYNDILKKISEMPSSEKEAEQIEKFAVENNSKIKKYNANENTGVQIYKNKIPYLLISPRISNYINGFIINDSIFDNFIKIIKKFEVLHEYGHIYEYLKNLVENNSAELIDTINEKDRNKVIDSEGKANAYTIDNMYRKDRRNFIKNSNEINTGIHKEYIDGLKKYSRTYSKIKENIKKENNHFKY